MHKGRNKHVDEQTYRLNRHMCLCSVRNDELALSKLLLTFLGCSAVDI